MACPCRNRYYDKEIWRAILKARDTATDAKTRDRANHVIATLRERARFDTRSLELLLWLREQGYDVYFSPWLQQQVERHPERTPHLPKVTTADVPALIEALASDDPDEQQQALNVLCPGRARQYNRRVWFLLFSTCNSADPTLSQQAQQATHRLLEFAANDPRAHELLPWLYRELYGTEPATDNHEDLLPALTWTPEHPFAHAAHTERFRREDPALREQAQVGEEAIDRLIEAVHIAHRSRDLRMALHSLAQTGSPRALPVLQEFARHSEESVVKIARSLLEQAGGTYSLAG